MMELWIRSQDRTSLFKADKIQLVYFDMVASKNNYKKFFINGYGCGVYIEERALEVLDDIQMTLMNQSIPIGFSFVYEMPKD